MLEFTKRGIYCPRADIYIDPWLPVQKALITHAHSDHARQGMGRYLCHPHTAAILRLRLGADTAIQQQEYGQIVTVNGVRISLHPAGHIIGSAQVRLEYSGEVWVVSGDYKLTRDGISAPYEPVSCHAFVTESTFALPIYRFLDPASVLSEINHWWRQNAAEGFNTVLLAYALGKSQVLLQHLDPSNGPVFMHGAVANVNAVLGGIGYRFAGEYIAPETDRAAIKGAAVVAPPSALGSPWLKKLAPFRIALCSGWMQLRGARRRRGVDWGFVLSDHADWDQLNRAVAATGAETIYVTHGYEGPFARWLREEKGLDAHEVHLQGEEPMGGDL
ncbi:ligase-associated DNA damage response exonuclease [Parapedobacter sp. 10938]|uniref:ligase-associated DNA damage response exonuclease n=1 Tax=Parapedobacter flavus TaxID=3110225 RepID=UPI002DBF4BEF|nr:ligase-associated DNA damage response exonuclease [Parapedobacter sp. 10938]MEC3879651.1 ligase-associated DNA damage response exonuclease [Parapedobacter sp. 10938]